MDENRQVSIAPDNAPAEVALIGRAPDAIIDDVLLSVARVATESAPWPILSDIESGQQGVVIGALTPINRSLKNNRYTLAEMAARWNDVRDLLRERHGDVVTLYRADALEKDWHHENQVVYMGDRKLAERFATRGRAVSAFAVRLEDVIALNSQANGYWELIVRLPSKKLEPKNQAAARASQALGQVAAAAVTPPALVQRLSARGAPAP